MNTKTERGGAATKGARTALSREGTDAPETGDKAVRAPEKSSRRTKVRDCSAKRPSF